MCGDTTMVNIKFCPCKKKKTWYGRPNQETNWQIDRYTSSSHLLQLSIKSTQYCKWYKLKMGYLYVGVERSLVKIYSWYLQSVCIKHSTSRAKFKDTPGVELSILSLDATGVFWGENPNLDFWSGLLFSIFLGGKS